MRIGKSVFLVLLTIISTSLFYTCKKENPVQKLPDTTISGIIKDEDTQETIPGVEISTTPTSTTTQTQSDGSFKIIIANPQGTAYTINAKKDSYTDKTYNITLTLNSNNSVQYEKNRCYQTCYCSEWERYS